MSTEWVRKGGLFVPGDDDLMGKMEAAAMEVPLRASRTFYLSGPREASLTVDKGHLRLVDPVLSTLKRAVSHGPEGLDGVSLDMPIKGPTRCILVGLPSEKKVGDETVTHLRGKGLTFDPRRLDVEFDLLDLYRAMGEKIPAVGRVIPKFKDDGRIIPQTVINEPMGAQFYFHSAAEFAMGCLFHERGFRVDIPVAYGKFTSLRGRGGLELGYTFKAVVDGNLKGDAFLSMLNTHYYPKVREGKPDALGYWRHDVEEVCRAWGRTLRQINDRALTHGNPHIGQFRIGGEGLTVGDLEGAADLSGAPLPRAFSQIAYDVRNFLSASERLESASIYREYGIHPMGAAIGGYFPEFAGDPLLGQLADLNRRGQGNQTVLTGLFDLSRDRPVMDYADNPLVRLLRQTTRIV